jgi:hypothetical protein
MFGFGLVVLYLLRRSFKKDEGIRGPRYYATRHETEGDWEEEDEKRDDRRGSYGNKGR